MSIERIVFTLAEKFDEYDWDIKEENIGGKMYCILVNNYSFYTSSDYKKWCKILRKKYPNVRWFSAFKNFKHGK